MYLTIENDTVCPVEAFTMFGVSSSRGEDDKIGQFGSGAKHAVLLMLRSGMSPKIFLGEDELSFFTEPMKVGEKQYSRIGYTFQGKKEYLSYTLEFGAIDWQDTQMALREFISNAIDAGQYRLYKSREPVYNTGKTCVNVELTPQVDDYYKNIKRYFWHFAGIEKAEYLVNTAGEKCRIYRRGVLIRELEDKTPSLFHYNFQDIPIDECRNLSDVQATALIAKVVSSKEHFVRKMFQCFNNGVEALECKLSYFQLNGCRKWVEWWNEETDNAYIAQKPASQLCNEAIAKGLNVVLLPQGWYEELKARGVKPFILGLSDLDARGFVEMPIDEATRELVNKVHKVCESLYLNAGKPLPKLKMFSQHSTKGGEITQGFCSKDVVYINVEYRESVSMLIEELGHYYTGHPDFSRGLQNFAFEVAARLMKERL